MPTVIRSALAKEDLVGIWSHIADRNTDAADRVLGDIEAGFMMLARNPGAGRRRQELGPHFRSFPVGNFVIFYRQMEDGIYVFRVVHGARDLPELF